MSAKKLLELYIEKPDLGLIYPYSDDIWDMQQWDYYKNSSAANQSAWKSRTSIFSYKADFTICKNVIIREELKYFFYKKIAEKAISLRTLAEDMDRMKLLCAYIGSTSYSSIVDVDTDDFTKYIIKTGHKEVIDNGTEFVGMQEQKSTKRNRIISFLDYIKKTINIFYEESLPLMERKYWRPIYFQKESSGRNISFMDITQPVIEQGFKKYLKIKLEKCAFDTAYNILRKLKFFSIWLADEHEDIQYFDEINRDIIEEYFEFLRLESGFSQHDINSAIIELRCFFDYLRYMNIERIPQNTLILNNDSCMKTQRESKFFTDDEIVSLLSITDKIDKKYATILFLLYMLGCRISELLKLKSDKIIKEDIDGNISYYINLYMFKTLRYNRTPINKNVYEILTHQIKLNKTEFGAECADYVFLNDKNKHINYHAFTHAIKKAIYDNNILDRNGLLLDFKAHRLRATKATKLIKNGLSAKQAAQMLGHKNLESLTYYVTMTKEDLYVSLQPMLTKASVLINSIGKEDALSIEDYAATNASPLCNGWCVKDPALGECEHANACLSCPCFKPSKNFLSSYYQHLEEVNAVINFCKVNGNEKLLQNNLKIKESLENIIQRVEER